MLEISLKRNNHFSCVAIFLIAIVLLSFFTWVQTGAGLAEVGFFVALLILSVKKVRFTSFSKLLLLFFSSVLFSSLIGLFLGYEFQFRILISFFVSVIFIIFASSYDYTKREIDVLFDIYVLSAVIGSVFILINVLRNHQYGYFRYSATFWGVDRDSLYLCAYQAGALFVSFNRILNKSKKRISNLVFSSIIIIGQLFTGNRSSLLVLGFIVLFSLVMSFIKSKNKFILLLISILLFGAGLLIFYFAKATLPTYIAERLFDFDNLTNNETRIVMWKESLSLFFDHPIFGIGLENNNNYLRSNGLHYSHNVFLDIACSQGIVGILIFIIIIVYLVSKSKNKFFSIGFAISSFITLFFVNGYNTMTFWIPILLVFLQTKYNVE